MKFIILVGFLTTSCSIVPNYRVEKVKQCYRDSYGTLYCEDGVFKPRYLDYEGCSTYDAPNNPNCEYVHQERDLPWQEEFVNEKEI